MIDTFGATDLVADFDDVALIVETHWTERRQPARAGPTGETGGHIDMIANFALQKWHAGADGNRLVKISSGA